jgi:hypothetical protein
MPIPIEAIIRAEDRRTEIIKMYWLETKADEMRKEKRKSQHRTAA